MIAFDPVVPSVGLGSTGSVAYDEQDQKVDADVGRPDRGRGTGFGGGDTEVVRMRKTG